MRKYSYKSYDEYVAAQVQANLAKLKNTFACPYVLNEIVNVFRETRKLEPRSILCHGARNGSELTWFSQTVPGARVVGTDISPTAEDHGLVMWDFHKRNPSWSGLFDIVYTNSFDHAIEPELAVHSIMDSVSDRGFLVIEYNEECDNEKSVNKTDCFGASREEYLALVHECGFEVFVDKLVPYNAKSPSNHKYPRRLFFIQSKNK